ncbi:MAG: flippase [archaeon]|nr:flippase [Candidatus Micrarchaeota archaeon]MBU1886430.1 flippase [Candidatus Micrarchaeota archaeon]
MGISISTKEVVKGTIWSLAGSITIKLVSFFYLVFLTGVALKEDIGTFYLALSLLTFATLFVDIISSSFTRFIPFFRVRGEGKKILRLLEVGYCATVVIALIISLFVYFMSKSIADFYSNSDLTIVLQILSIYLFLSTVFNLSSIVLRSMKRIKDQAILLNVQNFSKLVLLVFFSFGVGVNLFTIVLSFLLSYVISVFVSILYVRSVLNQLSHESSGADISYLDLLAEVVPFGLMLTATSSLWTIISSTDRSMLGFYATSSDVAIYTVATSLSILILIFPSAIGSIFFPLVSQLYGQKKIDEIGKICEISMRWLLFATIPFATVFIVFSSDLLSLFYGEDYRAGAIAMALFTFGLLIRTLSDIPGSVLASMRLVHIELLIAFFVLVINFVLNLLLIPQWGIDGAAFASLISFTIATLLTFHYSRKFFDFKLSVSMLKLLVAGMISFLLISVLHPYILSVTLHISNLASGDLAFYIGKLLKLAILAIFFSLCLLVFSIFAILLKSFKSEDLDILEAALKRARVIPEPTIAFIIATLSFGLHKEEK